MAKRDITLQVTVRVPAATGESEVESALNAALDESPETGMEWGDWEVGAVSVVGVQRVPDPDACTVCGNERAIHDADYLCAEDHPFSAPL